MNAWRPTIERVGGGRIIGVLGGLFVVLGVLRVTFVLSVSEPALEALIDFVLIGLPGAALIYGGYWLFGSDIDPEVHSRAVGWCLGALGVMLGVVLLLVANPASTVDRPVRAAAIAAGLGAIGGFGIGINNARALSRAREAERRSQELERTKAELEETVAHLETANDRLEQFAHAASHDLQEPLRMVSSYLQLLERRYEDDLDEEAKEYLAFAVDGADRMRAMVDSLLDYSRVTTRETPMRRTDVEEVHEGVLDDLALQVEETDATVTTDDLPTVTADPDQLAQVFQNLVSNALAYSGDGPPQVHVSTERTDGAWRFSVADDGVGIDSEYHDQIFEVFERLHTDGDETARGIGLALCKRIVERHGGDIWVESEPGEGATFYFTIPTEE